MKNKHLLWFLLNLYIAALIYISFVMRSSHLYMMNAPLSEYVRAMTNLVPFSTITAYVRALIGHKMNLNIPIINLLGNTVLYMPFAYLLQSITGKRGKQLLPLTLSVIVLVEILQVVTRSGSFDIDDIILNLFGVILIFYAFSLKRPKIETE